MIKKVVLMFGLFFMVVPISSFAAPGGIFDGKGIPSASGDRVLYQATDNDHNTSFDLRYSTENGVFNFEEPLSIDRIYIGDVENTRKTYIKFYSGVNRSGSLLGNLQLSNIPNLSKRSWNTFPVVDNVRSIVLDTGGSNVNNKVSEIDFKFFQPITYQEIVRLESNSSYNSVLLSWEYPQNNSHLAGVNIYRNDEFIENVDIGTNTYKDIKVDSNKEYLYTVKSLYDDGHETNGLTNRVKTKEPEPLILKNLKASTDFNRVDLDWTIPNNDQFKHVNIYRDKKESQTALENFLFGNKAYAAATTKIFETNGTYFNDLSVEPETTYEYTLSITDTDGQETGFTDIEVTTPAEPSPVLEDGNLEETETGDYRYTWSEPSEGTVRIIVGGQEYTTIPAADKAIIIPKSDMKYTAIGDPDVKAIPISESGKEGETAKPPSSIEKSELPFGAKDLVGAGTSLLWLVGPFVLLWLSFLLVPKFRKLIFNAFKGKSKNDRVETERRTESERTITDKQLRKPRITERQMKEPRLPRVPRIARESREGRQYFRESRTPRESRNGR